MRLRRYRTREFTEALQQHLHEAKQAALCDAGQPFQWGQIGGLDPQDRETRCAILQKKASDKGYQLSPEVIEFLADSIRSSARRLEGALTRVGALSMCHKSILTVPFARQLLRDVLEEEEQLRKTGGC